MQAAWFKPWQVTEQSPSHETRQFVSVLQSTWLCGPTCASQSVRLLQVTTHESPQMAAHCRVRSQFKLQWLPHEVEQVSTSWHVSEQLFSHTLPQFLRLWQSC
jgi:hypothetical protein